MAREIRTILFQLNPEVSSLAPDFAISASCPGSESGDVLKIEAGTSPYPIGNDKIATFPQQLGVESVGVMEIDVHAEIRKKVGTRKYPFNKVEMIKTRTVTAKLPDMGKRVHKISCRPPSKMKTFFSPYPETMPIGRRMLNPKHIPFPVISEFMSELARRNGTNYTNIRLIGAFDPIPMHLAEKLVIDPTFGTLKYHIRKEPKGERQFARVVYGRLRDTGKIISAVFPVT
jgi:hypothetical protein